MVRCVCQKSLNSSPPTYFLAKRISVSYVNLREKVFFNYFALSHFTHFTCNETFYYFRRIYFVCSISKNLLRPQPFFSSLLSCTCFFFVLYFRMHFSCSCDKIQKGNNLRMCVCIWSKRIEWFSLPIFEKLNSTAKRKSLIWAPCTQNYLRKVLKEVHLVAVFLTFALHVLSIYE